MYLDLFIGMDKSVCLLVLIAFCYVSGVPMCTDSGSNRIINGIPAHENQFPYAVSIQSVLNNAQQTETRGHRCGGALVTLQHVLTTASCVTDVAADGTTSVLNLRNYQVFAGSTNLTNQFAGTVKTMSAITLHPDYLTSPEYQNDIAVITLLSPFEVAVVPVVPVSLPDETFYPLDFSVCYVAGWGATTYESNAVASVELSFAPKFLYNENLCTSLYQNLVPVVSDTTVCAGSADSIAPSCTGDIGNALICDNIVTGLLFHHYNCSRRSPEVYTRVSNYTTWIISITGSANNFIPGIFMLALLTISQIFVAKVVS